MAGSSVGNLVVAGSGKMARDIGLYFLRQGRRVAWLSRDPGRLEELSGRMRKAIGRLSRLAPGDRLEERASFHGYEDPAIPDPEMVIECVNEDLGDKREVFRRLEGTAGPEAILASASSSILPREIDPRCLGLHFFYPLELTLFAEAIFPDRASPEARRRVVGFMKENGLGHIEQGEATAFAVNRLLLPIQAECFRALAGGVPATAVEEASRSCLFPVGQLGFMDSVGLDVICPAVTNYLGRLPGSEAADYAPLEKGLVELLALGKRGRKNGDGLLAGRSLPWPSDPARGGGVAELAQGLLYLILNTCCRFLEAGRMDAPGQRLALTSVFQAECFPEEVLRREGAGAVRAWLEEAHRRTGLSYFRPAAMVA